MRQYLRAGMCLAALSWAPFATAEDSSDCPLENDSVYLGFTGSNESFRVSTDNSLGLVLYPEDDAKRHIRVYNVLGNARLDCSSDEESTELTYSWEQFARLLFTDEQIFAEYENGITQELVNDAELTYRVNSERELLSCEIPEELQVLGFGASLPSELLDQPLESEELTVEESTELTLEESEPYCESEEEAEELETESGCPSCCDEAEEEQEEESSDWTCLDWESTEQNADESELAEEDDSYNSEENSEDDDYYFSEGLSAQWPVPMSEYKASADDEARMIAILDCYGPASIEWQILKQLPTEIDAASESVFELKLSLPVDSCIQELGFAQDHVDCSFIANFEADEGYYCIDLDGSNTETYRFGEGEEARVFEVCVSSQFEIWVERESGLLADSEVEVHFSFVEHTEEASYALAELNLSSEKNFYPMEDEE